MIQLKMFAFKFNKMKPNHNNYKTNNKMKKKLKLRILSMIYNMRLIGYFIMKITITFNRPV